jgi:D-threo-aldose 1-dehydrogenase
MDPLKKNPIGRTSLQVTQFGFGTAPLGGFRDAVSERDAVDTIEAAHEAGIRLFDTSPFYGYGRSEARTGAALRDRPRGDLVLSTKIGRWMTPLRPGETPAGWRPGGLHFVPTFDYSYDGVHRSLEQSLLRLGMNRVDILFIHDVDFWTVRDRALLEERFAQAMGGAYKALDELRRAGTIGAIGVGLNESDMSARFVRAGDFDCVLLAGRYTLLEQGALAEFMPLCTERGVSVIIGGPLNSGILATGARPGARYDYGEPPPEILDRVRRIEAVCSRHDVPMPAAALQFPLAHEAVSAIIPGAMSRAEITANLDLFRRPIPSALWDELRHERLLDPAAPVPSGVA